MSKKINFSGIITYMMIFLVIGFLVSFIAFKIYQKKTEKNSLSTNQTITQKAIPPINNGMPEPHAITRTVPQETDNQKKTDSTKTEKLTPNTKRQTITQKVVRKAIEKDKIIRYETVKEDQKHPDHALMEKRKKQFGIEKSLDMIVRSDEKVQVGDSIAPIQKIADRLQLDQGKIIEDELTDPFHPKVKPIINQPSANQQTDLLKNSSYPNAKSEKKASSIKPLQSHLNHPVAQEELIKKSFPIELGKPKPVQKKEPDKQKERIQVVPKIAHENNEPYEKSRKITIKPFKKESEGQMEQIFFDSDVTHENIEQHVKSENNYPDVYHSNELYSIGNIAPETRLDVYPPTTPRPFEDSTYLGIRVVRPGTNIWDIHFELLKEYFDSRGITLSPLADEPRKSGESSGVGKILKFSEQLVNIYNLESQTFEDNLNVIQPMSVIVIYNMTQIFGILDQIDYSFIDRIEFDGKSLWVPSY